MNVRQVRIDVGFNHELELDEFARDGDPQPLIEQTSMSTTSRSMSDL
jgi:hypothetical protein